MLAAAPAALAQTASQITPPTFRPQPQRPVGGLAIPERSDLTTPAGAEKLKVRLGDVRIEGVPPALAAAAEATRIALARRTVTAAEIFTAAQALEKRAAGLGLVLVRVVLPAQRIVNGAPLRLVVIDGFIERVDASAAPPAVRTRIEATLAPLVGRRGVTLAEVERALLLAGGAPGAVTRSALAGGSEPGGSILIIEARHKLLTGSIGLDNSTSKPLGRTSTSFGLELNSAAGLGEQLYVRFGGLPNGGSQGFFAEEPRNRSLAVGFSLPIGVNGLSFNVEGTSARTTPVNAAGDVGVTSDFERLSLRLRYPLIRSRSLTLVSEAAFDMQSERLDVREPVRAPLSLDRLRILRGSLEGFWAAPDGGSFSGRMTLSAGLDALGARRPPLPGLGETPLSRQGARPDFQKLDLTLVYNKPFLEHLAAEVRLRAQTSFGQALPRSEQLGLASPTGLSGLDSGQMQGDAGYVLRGELQAPFILPIRLPARLPEWPAQQGAGAPTAEMLGAGIALTPYVFGAFGTVQTVNPTALDRKLTRGISYGAGLRLGAAPQASFTNLSMTFELARAERSDIRRPVDRASISMNLQF